MAAKPPHVLLIDCPPSRHDDGGGGWRQQRQAWRNNLACCQQRTCWVVALVLAVAAFITGLTLLTIFLDRKYPSKPPLYTAAITGVAGLDVLFSPPLPSSSSSSSPAADDVDDYHYSPAPPAATLLSPVFNLTFQINNTRNANHRACLPSLSRADVSYGDAFLAGGSVPPFCAGEMRTSAAAARAWGQNVAVPRFLRDQLAAGDAAVDVKLTMPGGAVLSCKPKIGDGTYAACRLDHL